MVIKTIIVPFFINSCLFYSEGKGKTEKGEGKRENEEERRKTGKRRKGTANC